MSARKAVCSCGQLSVAVAGEPSYFGACSCRECQRATGSVFSMSAYFPRSAVQAIAGEHRLYRRRSEGGRRLDCHFCPTCGSMVYWHAEFDPDSVGISIGNFADPGFGPPQYAVWCESKHAWVRFPESCREFPRQPEL
jgi:hypothetical protein